MKCDDCGNSRAVVLRFCTTVKEDKERLTAYVHFLKRNFWNEVISKITDMQEAAVIRPINEILRKEMIDLEMTPTVGKRSATETPKEGNDYGD